MVDSTFKTAAAGQSTSEVLLHVLEISHEDISTIRLVNNTENITRNGNTFYKSNFEANIPDEKSGEIPQVIIKMENVDLVISTALETMDKGKDCTISLALILASDPDTTQRGPYVLYLKHVDADALWAVGRATFNDIMNDRFPKDARDPNKFPGMF